MIARRREYNHCLQEQELFSPSDQPRRIHQHCRYIPGSNATHLSRSIRSKFSSSGLSTGKVVHLQHLGEGFSMNISPYHHHFKLRRRDTRHSRVTSHIFRALDGIRTPGWGIIPNPQLSRSNEPTRSGPHKPRSISLQGRHTSATSHLQLENLFVQAYMLGKLILGRIAAVTRTLNSGQLRQGQ